MVLLQKLLITFGTLGLIVAFSDTFRPRSAILSHPRNALAVPARQLPTMPADPNKNNVAPNAATPTRTPTPINVGNFVWNDLDRDGQQDAGEPGLGSITVQLWNSTKTSLIGQTITNANGNYTLVAPTPGDYRVRVLLPNAGAENDQFSPKDAIGDDLDDSDINPSGTNFGFTDVYTFGSNLISITSIDAGVIIYQPPTPTRTPTPINIGNFVWHDLNGDGVQSAGEPGVGGVTVQLWNNSKTAMLSQTTTNGNGNYTLVAQLPGDYRIRVLLPTGASFALKDQGNDTTDSDINPSGADTGFSDVFTLASNVISITTKDAGLINVQPTATPTATLTPTITPTPTSTTTPEPTSELAPEPTYSVRLPVVLR